MAIEKPTPSSHDSEADSDNPVARRGILGKIANWLSRHDQEPPSVTFTVRIGGQTQLAERQILSAREKIEESRFQPTGPDGIVIVSRPNEAYDSSYVFRLMPTAQGLSLQCSRATPKLGSGFVVSNSLEPMADFSMAIDAQAKAEGHFGYVLLPKGTEIVTTRIGEIPEIEAAVTRAQSDPKIASKIASAQQYYQAMIDAATSRDR